MPPPFWYYYPVFYYYAPHPNPSLSRQYYAHHCTTPGLPPKKARPPPKQPRSATKADARHAGMPHCTLAEESPENSRPAPKQSRPAKEEGTRPATEEDARRARIPPGYSLKHWDPAEEPITVLGSVFDANSFGKWMYDWASYCHGRNSPISDMAGDMWLLLIQLAGKYKWADSAIENTRLRQEDQELVEDFLESGERLWVRLKKLLKAGEEHMYPAAWRKSDERMLGTDSGVAFIESIFGRDRQLQSTENLMANIRLWSMRF
jgi:hypothetical protein